MAERRCAVALARHYREVEGLSVAEIARHLGRSPATVKAYSYDPTGEKARAVKARYVGVCRGCGAYTQPRNGKGDAYAYCKACHPGAIERRWTPPLIVEAMRAWRARYGRLPSSYDWSRTHARRRGGEALERIAAEAWPAASVVSGLFGSWEAARAAASDAPGADRRGSAGLALYLSGMGVEHGPNVVSPRCGLPGRGQAASFGPGVTRQSAPHGRRPVDARGEGT